MNTEIRIGMIGNVDSGKTTLTCVLSRDILDDGKGKARNKIMKHQHERDTGRTSCISQHHIKKDNKCITLIDLAGHEKYFKTTITGMNRYLDYGCLINGSNMGLLRMAKEHLITALSIDIPIFIVMTKYDIAPINKYIETKNSISQFIHKKTNGKRQVKNIDDDNFKDFIKKDFNKKIIPLFTISSKTGLNISMLHEYINNLNQQYVYSNDEPANFIIEHTYNLKGIGTVLSGFVKDGIIKVGDILLMGSFYRKFYEVKVKSIHNNFREFVDKLEAGHGGCLNIKIKEKFNHRRIKTGIHVLSKPQLYSKFKAKIKILHHPTTIKIGYEPTIHCETISQTAKIIDMPDKYLRIGDTADVIMEFKYHPEFMAIDSKLIFREGKTKGIGSVIEIFK